MKDTNFLSDNSSLLFAVGKQLTYECSLWSFELGGSCRIRKVIVFYSWCCSLSSFDLLNKGSYFALLASVASSFSLSFFLVWILQSSVGWVVLKKCWFIVPSPYYVSIIAGEICDSFATRSQLDMGFLLSGKEPQVQKVTAWRKLRTSINLSLLLGILK
jgi:hypothetical protein